MSIDPLSLSHLVSIGLAHEAVLPDAKCSQPENFAPRASEVSPVDVKSPAMPDVLPPSRRVFLRDTYLFESEANVVGFSFSAVEGDQIRFSMALDETVFHYQGGGQPSDTGCIARRHCSGLPHSFGQWCQDPGFRRSVCRVYGFAKQGMWYFMTVLSTGPPPRSVVSHFSSCTSSHRLGRTVLVPKSCVASTSKIENCMHGCIPAAICWMQR